MSKEKKQYDVSTPVSYKKDGEEKTFWQRIGKGFQTEKGVSIVLNALPVNGKMFISEHKDDKDKKKGEEGTEAII